MQSYISRNKNLLFYLFFLIIFLLGLNVYKDYGLNLDDEWYRKNGELYYLYIKNLFLGKDYFVDIETLSKQIIGDIGLVTFPVIYELFLSIITDVFQIEDINKIYEFSHILNFSLFFISLIFFFKLIFKKFKLITYSYFSIIVLFFTPRFFAESFYNSRDIFFLTLFLFYLSATYNFLNKSNIKNAIYFSLVSAFLINAKIVGIIPPFLFLFFYYLNSVSKNRSNINELKFIFLIIPTTIFFIYIFWPYLWLDPITNIVNAYKSMIQAHENVVVLNFYMGETFTSTNTPWHYRIIWFLITTPISVLFLFIVGIIFVFIQLVKNLLKIDESNDDLWKNNEEMFDYYLFFIFIIVFFLTTKFDSSKFGSWRHIYFLYPIVIVFALSGLKKISFYLKNIKLKILFFLLISINFLYIFYWNYSYHPHQYVYFNYFAKNYATKNFDLDYWGLSNIHSLKHIIKNNKKYPIMVGTISFSDLGVSKLLLNPVEQKKIVITYDLNEADFLLDNKIRRIRKNYVINSRDYTKYFDIIVNDVSINTVYKKIN